MSEQQDQGQQDPPPQENNEANAVEGAAPEQQQQEPHKEEEAPINPNAEVHRMPGDLFRSCQALGFSDNSIKKAFASGCPNEDTITQWITLQIDHPELNTALNPDELVVLIVEKRHLTAEEREAKVAEMKQKVKENKLRDEQDMKQKSIDDEKRKREMGHMVLEAEEQRKQRLREQMYEQQRKDKHDDEIYRQKLHLEMAIDRLIRQGKNPDEAREIATQQMEEKRKTALEERDKLLKEKMEREEKAGKSGGGGGGGSQQQGGESEAWVINLPNLSREPDASSRSQQASQNSAIAVPTQFDDRFDEVQPATEPTALCAALDAAKDKAPSAEIYQNYLRIVQQLATNVCHHPLNASYRQVRTTSLPYQNSIGAIKGGSHVLRLCGFKEATPDGQAMCVNSVVMWRLRKVCEEVRARLG